MKIKIAETSGFCFGVKRAVNIAFDTSLKTEKKIYTFGPLIHNPQVLATLKEKGIDILKEIPEKKKGIVIIRAHGVPPDDIEKLKKAGLKVIDATCPKVIKVQKIIKEYSEKNYDTIIIGNENHPEVKGLMGYAKKNSYTINSTDEFKKLPKLKKAIIVAQTTQNTLFYKEIETLTKNIPNYKFFNTICNATGKRQEEAETLSKNADIVLVIGGKDSGNTKRLYEISKKNQPNSFHIETKEEIDTKKIEQAEKILLTAGASTPNWIIKQISKSVENIKLKNRKGLLSFFFRIEQFLLNSRIYLSLGAGSLTYAFCKLQCINNSAKYSIISICYVFFMHILNDFNNINSYKYNNPEKVAFFKRQKTLLKFFLYASLISAFITAYTIKYKLALLLVLITIPLFTYKMLPKLDNLFNFATSKTFKITAIWAILTTILPAISNNIGMIFNIKTLTAFFCSIGLVFARTSFFDILDIQGDKIAGKETLPMLIGEKKTFQILSVILILTFFILFFGTFFSILPIAGYYLAICPIFLLIVFVIYNKRALYENIILEFLVESNFILAGIITFIEFLLGNTALFMV